MLKLYQLVFILLIVGFIKPAYSIEKIDTSYIDSLFLDENWFENKSFIENDLQKDSLSKILFDNSLGLSTRIEAMKWITYYATYNYPKKAFPLVEGYIDSSITSDLPKHHVFGLHLKGYLLTKIPSYKEAIEVFYEELNVSQSSNVTEYIGHSFLDLGNVYEELGKYDSAIIFYQKGFEHGDQQNLPVIKARGGINVGLMLKIKGELTKALAFLLEAYQTAQNNNFFGYYPSINAYIGDIYMVIKNYKEAEKYYLTSLSYAQDNKNSIREYNALNKLAEIQIELQNIESALLFLEKSNTISETYSFNRANNFYVKAKILCKQNKYEESILSAKKAIQNFLEVNDSAKTYKVYPLLANSYLKNNDSNMAIKFAEKGLKKALEGNNLELAMNCELILYESYISNLNQKKALEHLKLYVDYNDSLRTQQKIYELLFQETQFRSRNLKILDSLENARIIEKKETEYNKEIAEKSQLLLQIIFFSSILFILFIIATVAWYISRQKRYALAEKKELSERALQEKEVLLKEIHHRVKNNLQLITSLLEMGKDKMIDEVDISRIEEYQSRIHSISLIHEKIYSLESFELINFQTYTESLLQDLVNLYDNSSNLKLSIEGNNLFFDIDTMVPLGVIIHELVVNAFKHAYNERISPLLEIKLQKETQKGVYALVVKDNGVGMKQNFQSISPDHIGLQLVTRLTKQLQGSLNYKFNQGSIFEVKFKDTNTRKELI